MKIFKCIAFHSITARSIGTEQTLSQTTTHPTDSGFEARLLNPNAAPENESGTLLADWLREREITTVDIVGIATDHCVRATALDAATAGFITTVLAPLTAAVTPENLPKVYSEMREAGATVLTLGLEPLNPAP